MKKYILISLLVGFIAGVAYVGIPYVFSFPLQNPSTSFPNSHRNATLLSASSTAGNSTRAATSTAIDISGAEKVLFEFSVGATTSAKTVDFLVYSASDTELSTAQSKTASNYINYQRFTDLVATNGASPTTADTYFARVGSVTITPTGRGATSTAAMDLTYGTWRSALCVASSTNHVTATCKILIEW